MSPSEQAADELAQGLLDIRRRFGAIAEETTGIVDDSSMRVAQQRFINESARQAAPLYAQLGEEVMTARLQGPSRAALNASDINTSQGASELNRLIRGDDSARDVNLAELKKQSSLLEAIERAVLQSTGVVVNL